MRDWGERASISVLVVRSSCCFLVDVAVVDETEVEGGGEMGEERLTRG